MTTYDTPHCVCWQCRVMTSLHPYIQVSPRKLKSTPFLPTALRIKKKRSGCLPGLSLSDQPGLGLTPAFGGLWSILCYAHRIKGGYRSTHSFGLFVWRGGWGELSMRSRLIFMCSDEKRRLVWMCFTSFLQLISINEKSWKKFEYLKFLKKIPINLFLIDGFSFQKYFYLLIVGRENALCYFEWTVDNYLISQLWQLYWLSGITYLSLRRP